MVLKKLLRLFGIKKGSKKGKSLDPLQQAPVPHLKANGVPDNLNLDPATGAEKAVSPLQKPELEGSSNIQSRSAVEDGTNTVDISFRQFDVVQDFSDHHYVKCKQGTTKEWVKTIQEEWRILEKDLPESIYVRVYEDRIDLLRVAIVGAAGTPYHDGLFFFDIHFPPDYPNSPPKVHYHSGGLRINPNLYEAGNVCLSLLNTWIGSGCEQWNKHGSTMLQVLVSIQGLVLNAKPYFNEPGHAYLVNKHQGEKSSLAYNRNTFLLSCKTMLYSLRRPPKHFENFVVCHFHERGRAILEACRAYMAGAVVGFPSNKKSKQTENGKKLAGFQESVGNFHNKLSEQFAANRSRALELTAEASSTAAEA